MSQNPENALYEKYPSLQIKGDDYWIKKKRTSNELLEHAIACFILATGGTFVWFLIFAPNLALVTMLNYGIPFGVISAIFSIPFVRKKKVKLSEKEINKIKEEVTDIKEDKAYDKLIRIKNLLDKNLISKKEFEKMRKEELSKFK